MRALDNLFFIRFCLVGKERKDIPGDAGNVPPGFVTSMMEILGLNAMEDASFSADTMPTIECVVYPLLGCCTSFWDKVLAISALPMFGLRDTILDVAAI